LQTAIKLLEAKTSLFLLQMWLHVK